MSTSFGMPAAAAGRRWSLREIVLLFALGAVFGVLYLAWVQVWLVAQAVAGPLAMDAMMGFWFTASIVAASAIRKPFAAFGAEVAAALAEILTGNPGGLVLLLTGIIQGAGAEVAFAATRWRRYDVPVLMASGVTAALASYAYTWVRFDYGALDGGLLVAMLLVRIASGVVLGGLLGWLMARSLARTGVFDHLAGGRAVGGA